MRITSHPVTLVCALALPACLDLNALQRGGQPPSQAPTDAAPPADLAALPLSACRSGRGTPLSERAVACQAVLAKPGDITNSCGSGWALCETIPTTPEVCASLTGGFYASSQRGSQLHVPPGPSLACTWSGPRADVDQRFLFGCGSTLKTTYDAPVPCGGFQRVILCRNGSAEAPTTWDCLIGSRPGDSDFADIVNTDGTGGVLCCR
jgi:hypothetical protein